MFIEQQPPLTGEALIKARKGHRRTGNPRGQVPRARVPKPNSLLENPKVKESLRDAMIEAQKIGVTQLKKGLLNKPTIANAMTDILEASSMQESAKEFIRLVFVERISKAKAVEEVFGKNAVPNKDLISMGVLNQPAVKEFLELIKLFYIEVSPLAALTEVGVLMDENTGAKEKLQAAKQIKATAGLTEEEEGGKKQLPVQITINMPGSVPQLPVVEVNPIIEGQVVDESGTPTS